MAKLGQSETIPWLIHSLLETAPEISSGRVADAAGVTRQAAHYHLRRMVEAGQLEARGRGRGSRYVKRTLWWQQSEIEGLEEDQVWKRALAETPALGDLGQNARSIAAFAFTEMVNNAIDHSGSATVEVAILPRDGGFVFTVEDQGIGAFERVLRMKGLEDHLSAVQEISKGKLTTSPEAHSGQGIFFTSKAVDLFVLVANGLRWTVDNHREDESVGVSDRRKGTLVRFEIGFDMDHSLKEVFDAYTDLETFAFSKSRTKVQLFEGDSPFVSRSEAKRLTRNLDRFEEVIVDFEGVREVGQAFADELFRVWQGSHPETTLRPVNMNEVVRSMVERARGDQ